MKMLETIHILPVRAESAAPAPLRGKKLYEGILKSRTEHVVVLEIDGEDVSFETSRIAMVRPSVQFE